MAAIIELIFIILIGWFFLSQIVVPAIKTQPLFPAFRSAKPNQVVSEIKKVEEELEAADLERRLKSKQEQLKTKRKDARS